MKIRDIIKEALDPRTIRQWGPREWLDYLGKQIQAGEIYKPDFTTAKDSINRRIEASARQISSDHYLGAYDRDDPMQEKLSDLYWSMPSNTAGLKKLERVAQQSPQSPYRDAMVKFAQAWSPVRDALEQLKPLVVSATQRREVKARDAAVQKRAEEGSAAALIKALAPNREAYIERARANAEQTIQAYKQKLKQAGGVDALAPPPDPGSFSKDHESYKKATDRRNFWTMIDKTDEADWIKRDVQGAADSYDQWTHKLIQKIGKPVAHAEVQGDPWTRSTVTVQTQDGETQVWYTQMILNTSKLGKVFNQFPTRRAK